MASTSRRTVIAALAWAAACPLMAATGDEVGLRSAIALYERTWNERNVAAWKDQVTADLRYQETYLHTDEARQMTTRERSLRAYQSGIDAFDFKWEPLRIHFHADGKASVVMRVVQMALPRTAAGYAATFETNPALTRWRFEDGRWKLYHYVTDARYARQLVADEQLLK